MTSLTFYGHACFRIKLSCGTKLLFDPFIRPNGLAKGVNVDAIQADYVLITHGHEDHVADAEEILKRTGAKLISNFEIVTWFAGRGITNAHPMNLGGGYDFPFGRVKSVNAVHSSTLPDGSSGGCPGGFVVRTPDVSFYVSGDTALHADQKLLGEMNSFDFAVLCIGDNFTMGPSDAVTAAQWIGVKSVVGVHYDTFPPIRIDREEARSLFEAKGITLQLPEIGETIAV